jgi:photosystem II stability/assembly factor-like uncharacterized protein
VTNDRDPIDAWLGADVEPLPPAAGAFERVHRRARRRKAIKAISAAAGAAVVVAAAATLPQVASGLLNGPSTGPANYHPASPGSTHPTGPPSATHQSSGRLSAAGPALRTAGKGPAPDAGLHPVSVTFVGNGPGRTLGAALGAAGSCGTRPCMVMAGTRNYGASWTKVGAPKAGPADGFSGVSQVRFLDPADGWVYGPALYVTHDGGRSWKSITNLPGRVIDLSTIGTRAFAAVGIDCAGTGSDFAANCARFSLYSAPVRGGRWRPVPGASGTAQVAPGGLQLTATRGYLIAGGRLYAGPVTGTAWRAQRVAGPAAPPCLTRPAGRGPWLLAPTASRLFLVCSRTRSAAGRQAGLYVSRDGGRTWRASGAAPAAAVSLAASPRGTLVLATKTRIYYSTDARTWHPAKTTPPARGFGFVGMTTDSNGVAVPANPGRALYVTTDGGQTWRARLIR